MKKILFIALIIIAGCKKEDKNNDPVPVPQPEPYKPAPCATISISRAYYYIGGAQNYTDSVLPTSYIAVNNKKKFLPTLKVIDFVGSKAPAGYEEYRDSIPAIPGDSVTLHIDMKHGENGVWVTLSQYPNGFPESGKYVSRFVCKGDTVSQSIHYTIK